MTENSPTLLPTANVHVPHIEKGLEPWSIGELSKTAAQEAAKQSTKKDNND